MQGVPADGCCRAFTYNTKARWCFLKSDFNQLKSFAGAVAGKLVPVDGDPDIGAPAGLYFVPASLADEARQLRTTLTASRDAGRQRPGWPGRSWRLRQMTNDPRTARQNYLGAIAISPDDDNLWIELSRALLAIQPANGEEPACSSAMPARRRSMPIG